MSGERKNGEYFGRLRGGVIVLDKGKMLGLMPAKVSYSPHVPFFAIPLLCTQFLPSPHPDHHMKGVFAKIRVAGKREEEEEKSRGGGRTMKDCKEKSWAFNTDLKFAQFTPFPVYDGGVYISIPPPPHYYCFPQNCSLVGLSAILKLDQIHIK